MAEQKNNTDGLSRRINILTFNQAYVPPTFKENKVKALINWGRKNLYPEFLTELYYNDGSATHKAIINRKVKLIAGNGFKAIEDDRLRLFVEENNLEKMVRCVARDYEIFNGFSIEAIWGKGAKEVVSLKYIPIEKLRIGVETKDMRFPYFWFSNDWAQIRKEEFEPEAILEFNTKIKKGKQIYWFIDETSPEGGYPIASYSNSMNWIITDHKISAFHLNQISQGYYPSMMLAINSGIATDEEMDYFERAIKENFAGENNSGKIFTTYNDGKEQAPELTKIDLNDSDKRFNLLKEQVKEEIIIGHEIAPQLLISVAGKLGGTEQRAELLEEFQASYIAMRQKAIEDCLNELLAAAGFTEKIELLTFRGDLEQEVVEDVDVEAASRAALKGSVGGVTGIIAIQQAVSAGSATPDAGAAILELIYGLEPDQALRIIGSPKPIDEVSNNEQVIIE